MIDIQLRGARSVTSTAGPDPRAAFAYPASGPLAPVFGKVLVAEHGELAGRVMRRLEKLGIATAAMDNGEDILEAAERCGADAIHPGYGPLAASAELAWACEAAGLRFVGPSAHVLDAISAKRTARGLVSAARIPVLPATAVPMHSVVERHVQVQVLADTHGNVVHIGERSCSIEYQREPLIDESPVPGLDPGLRESVLEAAAEAARAIGFSSAGTVAGVIAGGEFHFVEMHPLGQIAHSVSELTTGLDILREQLAIAAGWPLSLTQSDVWVRGHAIGCRITVADASKRFTLGHRTSLVLDDKDPTIATLIVWDRDREAATRRLLCALEDNGIEGPQTLCHRLLADEKSP